MWDLIAWLLLLIFHLTTPMFSYGSSEVIVPGSGHVQRLPHNLRPPLQESNSFLLFPRPAKGGLRTVTKIRANSDLPSSSPSNPSQIPSSSKSSVSSDMLVTTFGFAKKLNKSESSLVEREYNIGRLSSFTQTSAHHKRSSNSESNPLLNNIKRQRREDLPAVHNSTETKNESLFTNGTIIGSGKEPRAITDKEIVIIVICSAIGLVICLLAAALLAKFYWNKRHDDGGGYHGVLQKDTSEGNSPSDEQPSANIQGSQKDKDCRVHSNMFAQIDEMDEDSCSISPVSKSRRLSSLQSGEEGETKPLLTTCSLPTPSSNMEDTDSKLSESDAAVDGEINVGNGKREEDDVGTANGIDAAASNAVARTANVVNAQVKEISSTQTVEPEPRMYCRTGLSQSDYSLSSFTSVNPSYRYGNQVGYMGGYYGYPSDDATTPDADFDADDELLLPPPEFDFNPLTFNVSIAVENVDKESLAMIGDIPPPIDDGAILEMESPLDLDEDNAVSSCAGRWIEPSSMAVDNVSDFSTGVNVDESDVADCGACEEELSADGPLEENDSNSSNENGAAPIEYNGKDTEMLDEGEENPPSTDFDENVPLANHSHSSALLVSKEDIPRTEKDRNIEEKPVSTT